MGIRENRKASASSAPCNQPEDIDTVIDTLARPVLGLLRPAATRLQALSAGGLAGLDSAISLQLAQLMASLHLRYVALNDAATAERAVSAAIDLPQGLRAEVQRARGAALPEVAS